MTPVWAASVRHKMALYEITTTELASKRGYSLAWVSKLLKGRVTSTKGQDNIMASIDTLIAEKEGGLYGRF